MHSTMCVLGGEIPVILHNVFHIKYMLVYVKNYHKYLDISVMYETYHYNEC